MPRPKPTSRDISDRKVRATEWKEFRRDYLFTQKRLADIVGVSRRTIQKIEAAIVTPHPDTLRLFRAIQKKYEAAADV
jgi:DNA-binding XRE family transcriptional regulator